MASLIFVLILIFLTYSTDASCVCTSRGMSCGTGSIDLESMKRLPCAKSVKHLSLDDISLFSCDRESIDSALPNLLTIHTDYCHPCLCKSNAMITCPEATTCTCIDCLCSCPVPKVPTKDRQTLGTVVDPFLVATPSPTLIHPPSPPHADQMTAYNTKMLTTSVIISGLITFLAVLFGIYMKFFRTTSPRPLESQDQSLLNTTMLSDLRSNGSSNAYPASSTTDNFSTSTPITTSSPVLISLGNPSSIVSTSDPFSSIPPLVVPRSHNATMLTSASSNVNPGNSTTTASYDPFSSVITLVVPRDGAYHADNGSTMETNGTIFD